MGEKEGSLSPIKEIERKSSEPSAPAALLLPQIITAAASPHMDAESPTASASPEKPELEHPPHRRRGYSGSPTRPRRSRTVLFSDELEEMTWGGQRVVVRQPSEVAPGFLPPIPHRTSRLLLGHSLASRGRRCRSLSPVPAHNTSPEGSKGVLVASPGGAQ